MENFENLGPFGIFDGNFVLQLAVKGNVDCEKNITGVIIEPESIRVTNGLFVVGMGLINVAIGHNRSILVPIANSYLKYIRSADGELLWANENYLEEALAACKTAV